MGLHVSRFEVVESNTRPREEDEEELPAGGDAEPFGVVVAALRVEGGGADLLLILLASGEGVTGVVPILQEAEKVEE